ncbi:hypothetical protein CAEBREN_03463 [Caenorhabditis brenneri]|uniref:Uncharacterized protein n=1 Tax=Caenorhabditis brenneri TaxID=135651 RepID=G0MJF1_CAEBE|nr:hypothetical protein CAEBREN_03463 [Caenorhabditis brenneri]
MWFSHGLSIWLLSLWLRTCVCKAVDPLSDVILPLARVVNAISIQKQMCGDGNQAIPLVAEFLNIDKDDFNKFYRLKLGDKKLQLPEAISFVKNIPSMDAKNLDKTINGLRALTKAKEEEGRLNAESFKDPTELLKSSSTIGPTIRQNRDIDKSKFEFIENVLKEMEKQEAKDVDQATLNSRLFDFKDKVEYGALAIGRIAQYKEVYKDFYAFSDLSVQTGPFINLSNSIATVTENYADIAEFDSAVPILTQQSSNLRSSKSSFESFSAQLNIVAETLTLASKLLTSSSKKQQSVGFPRGLQDLKKLTSDFQNQFFLEQIVKEGNMSRIMSFLDKIIKTKNLELTINQLSTLQFNSQILEDYRNYQALFANVVVLAQEAAQNQDIEKALQDLSPCIKLLKSDDSVPDFSKLKKILEHVVAIDKKLSEFDQVMGKINANKGFESFKTEFTALNGLIGELQRGADYDSQKAMWDQIRKLSFLKTHQVIFDIIKELDLNPFDLHGKNLPVDILSLTLKSAQRTNLFDALKCLPSSSPDISKLIDSEKKVGELKSQISKLEAVSSVLANILKFDSLAMKSAVNLKSTNPSISSLCDKISEDFVKKAKIFVKAAGLLNDADMILKTEKSILEVAAPDDPVRQTAESVPGADFYNDDYRGSMVGLVSSVKKFFKTIGSLPLKTLEDVAKYLENLSVLKEKSVKGTGKLKDPISKNLAESTNAEVKNVAQYFKNVGELNMDFASFESVSNFQTFLDSFFEPLLTTQSETMDKAESAMNPILFWFLVVSGSILGVAALIFVVVFIRKCVIARRKKNIDSNSSDIESGQVRRRGRRGRRERKGKKGEKGEKGRSEGRRGERKNKVKSDPRKQKKVVPPTPTPPTPSTNGSELNTPRQSRMSESNVNQISSVPLKTPTLEVEVVDETNGNEENKRTPAQEEVHKQAKKCQEQLGKLREISVE